MVSVGEPQLRKKIAEKLKRNPNLKAMEADGLVIRKEYPQIPPKVEYSLSKKGRSLLPIMESMCQWGLENSGKVF